MMQPGKVPKQGERNRIGLLIDTVKYPYQFELLLGVHEQSAHEGLDVYCLSGGGIDFAPGTDSLFNTVGPGDFQGLIMSTGTMAHGETGAELREFLRRFGEIPVVSLSTAVASIPSVIIDNVTSVREITRHLIEVHRRKRIAIVRVNSPEGEQRFEGYRLALHDLGIPLDPGLVVDGEFTWNSGEEAVRVLFDERKVSCDAIIGANDWIALGALQALKLRHMSVPDDVALAGFDDVEDARFMDPPLTSVRQPVRDLGAEAVRLLSAMLRGEPVPMLNPVRTRLRYRRSCGCGSPNTRTTDSLLPVQGGAVDSGPEINIEHWASAMSRASPRATSRLAASWPHDLASALVSDLSNHTHDAFLTKIAGIVESITEVDSVPDWHDVIRALRASSVPTLRRDPDRWEKAESLFERAHLFVAAFAERVQGTRRIEVAGSFLLLEEISRETRSHHEDKAVLSVLLAHLPRLHFPSFFVARESGRRGPDGESQLLLVHNRDVDSRVIDNVTFRTGDLVPIDVRPKSRHTMVVHQISFGEEAKGFCAAEVGSSVGGGFETVPQILIAGLHNAHVMRKMMQEVSKREQAERARLEGEMKLAQRIQCEILPKAREVIGLEIAAIMVPATEVGGDYFDILPFDGGCWLGIGDVAGHGLDTGLIMLMIQSIVAATTRSMPNGSPKEVWQVVNAVLFENIRERLGRDEHATLSLLRYDKSGDIVFAGAHEDLIILRAADGRCEKIPTRGVWAGICAEFDERSLDVGHCRLLAGDIFVLYTDGITEAMSPEHEVFGPERLCNALIEVSDRSSEAIKDHVMARVFEWCNIISDDRTLLVARYTPQP